MTTYSKFQIIKDDFNYWCFSNSVAGKLHQNQDYAISWYEPDNKFAIAIVCDGHGAEKHFRSALGAKFAGDISLEILKNILSSGKIIREKDLDDIFSLIKEKWDIAIKEHFDNNPLNTEEKEYYTTNNIKRVPTIYGTTLNISVVTNKYWFAIKCGDGDIIKICKNNGEIQQLTPIEDKSEILNITHSLCDKFVSKHIYYEEIDSDFLATFVVSDGISNSFDKENYKQFINYLFEQQTKNKSFEKHNEINECSLNEFLVYISNNGSCDDASIAGIFNDKNKGV